MLSEYVTDSHPWNSYATDYGVQATNTHTFPALLKESTPRKQVRDSCHTSMHICVERMLLLTCCTETLTWPAIVPMVKAPE